MFCLLSTFWQGLLSTFALFALSFAAVLFVRLAVYYIKNSKKAETKPEPAAESQLVQEEKPPEKKPARPRRRVHTIEIRPDEINRIYVADRNAR